MRPSKPAYFRARGHTRLLKHSESPEPKTFELNDRERWLISNKAVIMVDAVHVGPMKDLRKLHAECYGNSCFFSAAPGDLLDVS